MRKLAKLTAGTRARLTSKSWIVAGAATGLAIASIAGPARADSSLKVDTTEGPVQGFLSNGVAEFRGIPYAEPPVANLRWRPPQRHAAWTKTLHATKFGPQCLQVTTLGAFAGPANANEDCLFLNVYSTHVDASGKEKMPVLVWIHGGGNIDGAGDAYDGSKMATDGHIVVVTINYRLGFLGFLAHPALDKENHPFANYGLLDQQAALRWVRRNIAGFGGDPNNVTLGGQSAGSVDTEANMISPLAKGLFHRAIFQSGTTEPVPLSTAEANGTSFAVAAGCGAGTDAATAACLRNLTAQKIFDLSGTASVRSPYINSFVADGEVLPSNETFLQAIKNGHFSHMPVMSGKVLDESNFSLGITEYFEKPRHAFTADDYHAAIDALNANPLYAPNTGTRAERLYPLKGYPTPQLALDALGTDPGTCGQRLANKLLSAKVPVYMYSFDERTAPWYFPQMPGFQPLAYHTADIQYVFAGWHGGNLGIAHELNGKQEALSDQMVGFWTNFARTGNPNGQGQNPWPKYPGESNAGIPAILSENIPTVSTNTDAQFRAAHRCVFWESVYTF